MKEQSAFKSFNVPKLFIKMQVNTPSYRIVLRLMRHPRQSRQSQKYRRQKDPQDREKSQTRRCQGRRKPTGPTNPGLILYFTRTININKCSPSKSSNPDSHFFQIKLLRLSNHFPQSRSMGFSRKAFYNALLISLSVNNTEGFLSLTPPVEWYKKYRKMLNHLLYRWHKVCRTFLVS